MQQKSSCLLQSFLAEPVCGFSDLPRGGEQINPGTQDAVLGHEHAGPEQISTQRRQDLARQSRNQKTTELWESLLELAKRMESAVFRRFGLQFALSPLLRKK